MAEESKKYTLEIVTPEKRVFAADVESLIAPGTEGYFQLLHNHAPFLSTIRIGEIRIRQRGQDEMYATSGGFVEVSQNKVSVLAETAERAADISVSRAEESKKRAEQRLQERAEDVDVDRAALALHRALNRMMVARKASGH